MNADERAEIAERFGVAPEQVERDHLISHLLAFLSQNIHDRIQFIGGTALARTHLPDGRLSEDIDSYRHRRSQGGGGRSGRRAATCTGPNARQAHLDRPLSGVANTVAAAYLGSTASMALMTSGASGSVRGRNRLTTSPSGATRNFSKFH